MSALAFLILDGDLSEAESEAIVQADYASHEVCRLRSCDGCDQSCAHLALPTPKPGDRNG